LKLVNKSILSYSVSRVLPKVFCTVDHVPFAPEVVDSVGDALGVDVFLGAGAKVFRLFEAMGPGDATFEHLTRFLTQRWVG